jgi:hypothetical protein
MKKLATILVVATLGSISFEVSRVAAEKSKKALRQSDSRKVCRYAAY